jgi:hypothetical protein
MPQPPCGSDRQGLIAIPDRRPALFRRVEVRKQPAERVGLHRVVCHGHLVNVIAGRTFECALVHARRTRPDMGEQHSGLAGGAKRVLKLGNRDAVRRGMKVGHDASPGPGGSATLSVTGEACRSADDGTSMIHRVPKDCSKLHSCRDKVEPEPRSIGADEAGGGIRGCRLGSCCGRRARIRARLFRRPRDCSWSSETRRLPDDAERSAACPQIPSSRRSAGKPVRGFCRRKRRRRQSA